MRNWQVRCYNPTGQRKQFDHSRLTAFSYTVEPLGGFVDGTFSMFGEHVEDTNLNIDDCIEMWDGDGTSMKYRGYISDFIPSEEDVTTLEITMYGRILDLAQIILDVKFQYAYDVDVSVIFADIAAYVQKRYPDIIVEINEVGVLLGSFDARGKKADEAIEELLRFVESTIRYGFDVDLTDPTSANYRKDRLYLRVIDLDGDANHVVGLQSPNVIARQLRKADSDQFTVAVVSGATPKFPQLAVNGSFEELRRRTDNDGNLLSNAGFEDTLAGPWTLGSGATIKSSGGDDGTAPRTGNKALELDEHGETAYQQDLTPIFALKEDTDYTFSFYAIPEKDYDTGDPPVMRYKIYWLDSGGATIRETTNFATASERFYKFFEVTSRSPLFSEDLTGFAVGFRLDESGDGGTNRGIWIDDVAFADASTLYATGWKVRADGVSVVEAVNWGAGNAYHGGNCLAIVSTAADDDSADVIIETDPTLLIDVIGGREYKMSHRFMSYFEDEAPVKHKSSIGWKDSDDNFIGSPDEATVNPASPVLDWESASFTAEAPSNAVKAVIKIVLRESGGIRIDSISFRDADDPSDKYLPEGNLNVRLRSDEIFDAGTETELHDLVDDWGEKDKQLDSDVDIIEDAILLARAEMKESSLYRPEPTITFADDTRTWLTTDCVRFIGYKSSAWQNGLVPVTRINGSIDGDKRIEQIEFLRKQDTTDDIVRRIQNQRNKEHLSFG